MSVETEPMTAPTPAATPITQFYYRVGAHDLLLEPDTLAEVLIHTTTSPLPFPPSWCKGLVAVRGEFYPLVDMHHILYGHANASTQLKLLWLKPAHTSAIVVACDSYPKALKFTNPIQPTQQAPPLPSWIKGIVEHENQTFLVADHQSLINKLMQATHS
jgi:chemotaxis signal transduction protein